MTKTAVRRTLLAVGAAIAVVALRIDASAGHGYTQYQQNFSSSDPTGYSIAPATTPGNSSVPYSFTATYNNLFLFSAPLTATVFVERVRTYTPANGTPVDISDGRSPASEAEILGAGSITGDTPATQPLSPQSQTFSGGQSAQYDESARIGGCGYWAIYVASEQKTTFANDDGTILNAGVVRVTDGCATAPSPTSGPPPTGSPSGAPAPSRTAGPTNRPAASPEATPSPSPSASATASPSPAAVASATKGPTNPPFPFANAGNVALTPPPDPAQLEGAGTSNTFGQRGGSLLGGSLFFAAAIIVGTGLIAGGYVGAREARKRRRRPA